jgi:hypothetical protein
MICMRSSLVLALLAVGTACYGMPGNAQGSVDAIGSAAVPSAVCHAGGSRHDLPDPSCTPGEADGRVTQANIHRTICVRGYSASVRPPVSETEPIKRERMHAYGMDSVRLVNVELDHVAPLSLGGASTRPNLWPQLWPDAHRKDALENRLHSLVCNGQLDLAAAQRAITSNWEVAYAQYVSGQ